MIRELSIRSGAAGTRQTLRVMKMIAREGARLFDVQRMASRFGVEDIEPTIRPRWKFVEELSETLYTIDRQIEHLKTYGYMIGDCDDAATAAAAVLIAKGVLCQFVAVRRPNDTEFSHVFVEAYPDGLREFVRIDPTAPEGQSYDGWERMVENV